MIKRTVKLFAVRSRHHVDEVHRGESPVAAAGYHGLRRALEDARREFFQHVHDGVSRRFDAVRASKYSNRVGAETSAERGMPPVKRAGVERVEKICRGLTAHDSPMLHGASLHASVDREAGQTMHRFVYALHISIIRIGFRPRRDRFFHPETRAVVLAVAQRISLEPPELPVRAPSSYGVYVVGFHSRIHFATLPRFLAVLVDGFGQAQRVLRRETKPAPDDVRGESLVVLLPPEVSHLRVIMVIESLLAASDFSIHL